MKLPKRANAQSVIPAHVCLSWQECGAKMFDQGMGPYDVEKVPGGLTSWGEAEIAGPFGAEGSDKLSGHDFV